MAAFPLAPLAEVGIYIHWPFCRSRCGYCHFYTETGADAALQADLGRRIRIESERYLSCWAKAGGIPRPRTLYLGGGTPSAMPLVVFHRLAGELKELWGQAWSELEEFTLEVNPEDVHPESLEAWEEAGVNRLSLGVQTLHDDLLGVLQRRARSHHILAAREAWLKHPWRRRPRLNLDLIVGIPGQTVQSLEEDLRLIEGWDPDHVSLYALSIDEGTPLHRRVRLGEVRPLPVDLAEDLWELADRWLEERGWKNYEVSNYARAGAESRHNVRYWRMEPWIGLGPTAVGNYPVLVQGQRPCRRKNPLLGDYGPEELDFWEQGETQLISRADFFLDFLITGLRLAEGLPFERLNQVFELDARRLLEPWIESLDLRGYLCYSERVLRLNRRGRFALDRLLVDVIDLVRTHPELRGDSPPRWP